MTADETAPAPVCVAVCLECGIRFGHLDLTAGNVAIDEHHRATHAGRRTFFAMPVMAIPDHLGDDVIMQVQTGWDRRTVPLPVGVLRRPTTRLRPTFERRYRNDTVKRLAASGRFN